MDRHYQSLSCFCDWKLFKKFYCREQKLAGMKTQILNLRAVRTKLEGQVESLAKEAKVKVSTKEESNKTMEDKEIQIVDSKN